MTAYIQDAVRTPRGKAKADGGLAALKPQQLVAALIESLEAGDKQARSPQALILGSVAMNQWAQQRRTQREVTLCQAS